MRFIFMVLFLSLSSPLFAADTSRPHFPVPPRELVHPLEEYAHGSAIADADAAREDAWTVLELQKKLKERHPDFDYTPRVFHEKSHGFVLGTFQLRPDIPQEMKHGLFAESPSKIWLVLLRYSNGLGVVQHDLSFDVRGVMVELLEFDPTRSLNDQTIGVKNFLMTNQQTPVGKTHRDFVEFAVATNNGPFGLLKYFFHHPEVAKKAIPAVARPVPSLLTESYFSGHPYLLHGNREDGRAFKFSLHLSPLDQTGRNDNVEKLRATRTPTLWNTITAACRGLYVGCDYLSQDMFHWLGNSAVQLDFSVQLEDQQNPSVTPIEDNSVAWNVKPVPVARITLLPQTFDKNLKYDGNRLGFNPRESAFTPISDMGWARGFSGYPSSQRGREAITSEKERLRQIILRRTIEDLQSNYPNCWQKVLTSR